MLGDDIWAHIKEELKVAKKRELNVLNRRLSQPDDTISSIKLQLISNFGNDVARHLRNHINKVCSQWAPQDGRCFSP